MMFVGSLLPSWLCLQVVDEKGNECPPGVEGEIVIQLTPNRPVGLFTRYVVSCEYFLGRGKPNSVGSLFRSGTKISETFLWRDASRS